MPNFSDPTQLDCIDESVDKWTYLTMMQRAGFLHFHSVPELSYAGIPTTTPRNTATLKERGGSYYAVDLSLVDAGVPPPIIPLNVWLASWLPRLGAYGMSKRSAG